MLCCTLSEYEPLRQQYTFSVSSPSESVQHSVHKMSNVTPCYMIIKTDISWDRVVFRKNQDLSCIVAVSDVKHCYVSYYSVFIGVSDLEERLGNSRHEKEKKKIENDLNNYNVWIRKGGAVYGLRGKYPLDILSLTHPHMHTHQHMHVCIGRDEVYRPADMNSCGLTWGRKERRTETPSPTLLPPPYPTQLPPNYIQCFDSH